MLQLLFKFKASIRSWLIKKFPLAMIPTISSRVVITFDFFSKGWQCQVISYGLCIREVIQLIHIYKLLKRVVLNYKSSLLFFTTTFLPGDLLFMFNMVMFVFLGVGIIEQGSAVGDRDRSGRLARTDTPVWRWLRSMCHGKWAPTRLWVPLDRSKSFWGYFVKIL